MKNYREQDGCWNCKNMARADCLYFCDPEKTMPILTHKSFKDDCIQNDKLCEWEIDRATVNRWGICDDHEKSF